jgi:hypothetical protein
MNCHKPAKLGAHIAAVRTIMRSRGWVTLREIELALMERSIFIELQSVSARVRDLRKAKFGSHIVDRRYVGNGIFQYRIRKGAA